MASASRHSVPCSSGRTRFRALEPAGVQGLDTLGLRVRDVGHEVPVHHVQVDPVGPGPLGLGHMLAQAGDVGGEDRGSTAPAIEDLLAIKERIDHPRHQEDARVLRLVLERRRRRE